MNDESGGQRQRITSTITLFTLLILLVAAFARFHLLDAQSLWNDEGNSLRLAQRDVSDLIDAAGRDIHPPGYYLALKGWIAVAGESEFSLRALSALAGILTVAATMALGRALFSPTTGLIAGMLVALSPFAVYYSQETRMYALLSLFSVLSVGCLVRWLLAWTWRSPTSNPSSGAWRWLILLTLCNSAGLYTQYSFPFTMIAQGAMFLIWLVVAGRHQRGIGQMVVRYVVANLAAISAFAPWLPTAWDQITTWPSTGVELAIIDQLTTVITWLTVGPTVGHVLTVLLLICVLVVLEPLLLNKPYQRPAYAWRITVPVWWGGIVTGALLISGAYREANLKFLLPAQIAVALMLAQGAVRWREYMLYEFNLSVTTSTAITLPIRRRRFNTISSQVASLVGFAVVGVVIAGQVIGLDHLYHDSAYARDDYRAIAAYIDRQATADDAIILDAPNQSEVFSYYYTGPATIYELPRGLGGDDALTRADVINVIETHRRIYALFWGEDERDPNRAVQATLDAGAYPVSSMWYGDVRLAQYAVLSAPAEVPAVNLVAHWGQSMVLIGYVITPDTIRAGDVIGVTLFWQADDVLTARYKVTVQLLAPDGSLVTQHDAEPGGNLAITTTWVPGRMVMDTHGLIVPPDRAPGRYSIIVGVYPLNDPGLRLPVTVGDADPQDALVLAEITLE